MSDPDMLEEWALQNNCYEEFFGRPPETSHLYQSVVLGVNKTTNDSYVRGTLRMGHNARAIRCDDSKKELEIINFLVNGKRR